MLTTKTPRAKAPGVFFRLKVFVATRVRAWSLALPWVFCTSFAFANCPAQQIDEVATVAHIYDGDTLRLTDGRRVRVLGINVPEMASNGRLAEPLGQAGLSAAKSFFKADMQVQLSYDEQRHDRYGRVLAHVYNTRGESLAARLLRDGVAFHIVVPPNLSLAKCLQKHERQARRAGKGVWLDQYWRARPAAGLTQRDTGFLRVQGKVVKVTEGRDIWLELDGPLVLKIAAQDKHLFHDKPWRTWRNKNLEVTGWVVDRSSPQTKKKGFKPLQLQLRSAYAVVIEPK